MNREINYTGVGFAILAAWLGLRSCRVEGERSVLERRLEEISLEKTNKFILNYIEENADKLKQYAPILIRVAKEKGYLKDILNSMNAEERRAFFRYIVEAERKSFIKGVLQDFEFASSKESYLSDYKKRIESMKGE